MLEYRLRVPGLYFWTQNKQYFKLCLGFERYCAVSVCLKIPYREVELTLDFLGHSLELIVGYWLSFKCAIEFHNRKLAKELRSKRN